MGATFLYQRHVDLGAKMTSFSGWDMPLRYISQIQEHMAVREASGMFDVSHMLAVDITGSSARTLIRRIHSNDVDKSIEPGTALYGCMLNERGGVQDDIICYVINEQHYRIVINAGRREEDMRWIQQQSKGLAITLTTLPEAGILAVQGPLALTKIGECCPDIAEANTLQTMQGRFFQTDLFVARSGYTGEDGVEIIASQKRIERYWDALVAAGVQPCGLGARDSLRLEAGLCLYGHELGETISPLEAGIGWCVDWNDPHRDFIGKAALVAQKEAGRPRKLVGLLLTSKGIMRAEQMLLSSDGKQELGMITSGGFSPFLGHSIAVALMNSSYTEEQCLVVDARGKQQLAKITKPTFVRKGKALLS